MVSTGDWGWSGHTQFCPHSSFTGQWCQPIKKIHPKQKTIIAKCHPYVIEGGDPVQDQETSPGAVHVCSVMSDSYPMDCNLPGSSVEFFRQEYWSVGCYFLLQGIFPTQGSNPHLHWQVGSLLSPGGKRDLRFEGWVGADTVGRCWRGRWRKWH